MFTAIYSFIFTSSRLSTLRQGLLILIILSSSLSESFQLDSKSLKNQKDYFSKLNKKVKYKPLNDLILSCESSKKIGCLKNAQDIYIDPEFKSFRGLVSELTVSTVIKLRKPIFNLSFLKKDEIKERELRKIFKKYSAKEVTVFFKKGFFLEKLVVRKIFLKDVNLLCKFSGEKYFTSIILALLPAEEDLYEKSFSKFPCGLKLEGGLALLGKEIKKYKSRSSLAYDYKFKFLREKAAKEAYRRFPKYKKRSLSYRKTRIWKNLLKQADAAQIKISRNLFFKGEYKVLSHAKALSNDDIKALPVEVIEYVIKSFIALGEYGDALNVSDHVEEGESLEASEEVFLMRGNAYLRTGEWGLAEKEYKKILRNVVDLKLSALYWLRTALRLQNKKREADKIDVRLLKSYPFSYYGILVAREKYGASFFEDYKKESLVRQDFAETLSHKEIQRLSFYYSYKQRKHFKRTFRSLEKRLNPSQKALFSLVFENIGDRLEIIRSLNLIWDLDEKIRAEPFLSASFPQPYKKEIENALKKKTYTNEALIYAIMRQESAFGPVARSPSGARGLMQLLPSTARDVAKLIRYKGYRKTSDLYKPRTNIYLGSKYVDRLIRAGKGYLPYAFASYNAGPGKMYRWSKFRSEITDLRQGFKKIGFNPIDDLWIEELPWSETRFYTKALLRNMGIYTALKGKQNGFNCTPFWACSGKNL